MFIRDGILFRSTTLSAVPGVCHGFSTREGGASTLEHTKTLNLTGGQGDAPETVLYNLGVFARAVSDGKYGAEAVVRAHQIHSSRIRQLAADNAGEGTVREAGEDCDGFYTDQPGVMPVIRVADCVPILFAGLKADSSPVVAAVHAGWRGTVSGIAPLAVERMLSLGCEKETIRAAVGAHIGFCCYEVGDDFFDAVRDARGADFAARHVRRPAPGEKRHADLSGMNLELLCEAGIAESAVDFCPLCTMEDTKTFYSHRGMNGKRGTMGAGIVIRG
ncbi:MAG: laccase domain-containing protein [Clostridia bacterium]|nr:laccase domain-containing protein [Clostridia bacterium]